MDTSKCSQWGCQATAMEWEALDVGLDTVIASYCATHADEARVQVQAIEGVQFRKITGQGEITMSAVTPVDSQMAPPDAVYDELEDDIPGSSTKPPTLPPTPEEASTNFFWKMPGQTMTFDLQTTVRGAPTTEQLTMHIGSVVAAMRTVVANGGKAKTEYSSPTTPSQPTQPQAPPPLPQGGPVPVGAAPTPPALPVGVPPVPMSAPSPAQPQGGAKPIQTLQCVKIKIVPRTDGKSEIHFFQNGAQYPNLKLIREVHELVEFMAALGQGVWLDQHMRSPGDYTYACKVQWQESDKLNSKGNPYRNVISIAP